MKIDACIAREDLENQRGDRAARYTSKFRILTSSTSSPTSEARFPPTRLKKTPLTHPVSFINPLVPSYVTKMLFKHTSLAYIIITYTFT